MTLFLLAFFFLYSLLHLYVFLKAKAAFGLGVWTGTVIILFMTIMIFAPVIVRFSEKRGLESFAQSMAYIGYIWMGIILLFCSVSLTMDIWNLLMRLTGSLLKADLAGKIISNNISFIIPALLSVIMAVYGYFEAKHIRVETVTVKTAKIPKDIGRIRLVQISDIHLGLIVRHEKLQKIVNEVKTANPDILVSTGDLVDGQINSLAGLAELLQEITPRYGKYAITGNHEFYAGINQSLDFIKKAGFTILRGEMITVEGLINIAGFDDPAGKTHSLTKEVPEAYFLSGLPREKFTILLKHRPVVDKGSIGLFDLQLSGHTHKGQMFPFSIATWLYYPVHAGKLIIRDSSYLYVSRGAGTWGPPIRFLSPPEVTVIDIVRDDAAKTERPL